jgi:hypothetical protein
MRRALLVVLAAGACNVRPLAYQCATDRQCSGSGGRCLDSACAFPSTSCDSGYAWDSSAAGRGGQCVSSDLLVGNNDMGSDQPDMTSTEADDDMSPSTPPDMVVAKCSWHASSNLPEDARRIWASDSSHLWAAGDNLMSSNTSGVGWSTTLLRDKDNVSVHVNALLGFGSTVFAACSRYNVFRIDASGATLEYPNTVGFSSDLFGLWGASATDLWAIGDGAIPLRRQGTTWTVGTGSVANGNDMHWMHGTSASNIWAAGDFSVTHWDGKAWTPQNLAVGSSAITSVFVLDDKHVYLTQGSGAYYATRDGGVNWGGGMTGLTSGSSIFGFAGHLYVAGNGGSIAHSTDDGAHWNLEDTGTPQTGNLSQIWGRSPTELYVVGGKWWSVCKPD